MRATSGHKVRGQKLHASEATSSPYRFLAARSPLPSFTWLFQSKNVPKRPVVLVVLDGWGYRAEREGNAIALASTPTWDALVGRHPTTLLDASGLAVGLPAGQMGNSEVGHLNLGAGRVVMQDLVRIDESIKDRSFFRNSAFVEAYGATT